MSLVSREPLYEARALSVVSARDQLVITSEMRREGPLLNELCLNTSYCVFLCICYDAETQCIYILQKLTYAENKTCLTPCLTSNGLYGQLLSHGKPESLGSGG